MISLIKITFCYSLFCLAALVQLPLLQYDFHGDSFVNYDYSLLYIVCFILSIVFKNNFAFIASLLYLLSGLMGLPIFAFGGGWEYIFEPSFAYLAALPVLSMVGFFTRYHWTEIGIKTFNNKSTLPLVAMLIAHLIGVLALLLTHRLSLHNFMSLTLYQLAYDLFFAHLAIIFVPLEQEKDT